MQLLIFSGFVGNNFDPTDKGQLNAKPFNSRRRRRRCRGDREQEVGEDEEEEPYYYVEG